ncbi:MAG: hypothetical protein AAGA74_20495 [Pseudomonadota bacterium]
MKTVRNKPSWRTPIALSVVIIALVFAIVLSIPHLNLQIMKGVSEVDAAIISSLIGGTTGLAGILISGFIGLTIIRRDKFESDDAEFRAVCAALSAELSDNSSVFSYRMKSLIARQKLKEKTYEIDFEQMPVFCTFVYQASVDRIGLLGPDFAREVVALYGRTMVWSAFKKKTCNKAELTRYADRAEGLSALCSALASELLKASELGIQHNYEGVMGT